MKVLLWIIRIYIGLLFVWALSSWFGGLPAELGRWLSWAMWPVWTLFGWAHFGAVNFSAVIALLLLLMLESWLKKQCSSANTPQEMISGSADPPAGS